MLILISARGYGFLVPATAAAALAASVFIGRALHVAATAAVPFNLAAAGVVSGLVLWLIDRRIREGSGYVSYDAQSDQPVVEDEETSPFLFLTMRAWALVLPLLGVGIGLVMWLGR